MYQIQAKLPALFGIVIASLLGTGLTYATVVQPVEIHIGIYAPFSNEQAYIGRNILGAMEMARDQLPEQQIIYSFYPLNKAPDSPVTATTLQKFIAVHHIQVLVTEGAESGLMAAPVARKNNIVHFSLAENSAIADGKNNFLAWNSAYKHAAVIENQIKPEFIAQYLEMYQSHPVTEAGHAYDVFHIIHKSSVQALKSKHDLSKPLPFDQVQILAAGPGIMGHLTVDKNGVLYAKADSEAVTETVG